MTLSEMIEQKKKEKELFPWTELDPIKSSVFNPVEVTENKRGGDLKEG